MSDHVLDAADGAPLRTKVASPEFYAGLDPGIRFAVRVLHAHGIETCQSCESGPGHCYPEPTVDLLAGPNDATGFAAVAYLDAFGLPVSSVSKTWMVVHGEPYEAVWRITFAHAFPERADEPLMFLWGYQAQPMPWDSDAADGACQHLPAYVEPTTAPTVADVDKWWLCPACGERFQRRPA